MMTAAVDGHLDHLAHLLQRVPDHLERLTWSRERIAEAQATALRSLLTHAVQRSAFHRERLKGIAVDKITPSDLDALPTMTKLDLMASWDDVVTDCRVTLERAEAALAGGDQLHGHHAVASGGSSGERGVFVYDCDELTTTFLATRRFDLRAALAADETPGSGATAVVVAESTTHLTAAVAAAFSSPLVPTHRLPVTMPLADIVDGLNELQPTTLVTYASMLGLLVCEAEAGRLRISPARVTSTSEPLLLETRSAVLERWGLHVANVWGTSEAGVVASGCGAGPAMHLTEDLVIVEPTASGVLVTNLFNHTLPLLRYELSDQVRLLEDSCPCGSQLILVDDIEGRADDVLWYGGVPVHPHVLRSALVRHRAVVEHRVEQTPTGCDVAVLAGGTVDVAALADDLRHALAAAGVANSEVTVRVVDELQRTMAGKLQRYVPLPT